MSITHVAFRGGYLPEALTWMTIVLIPKGVGGYIGIGLVEVIWKVCTLIIKDVLRNTIILHDALHGFRQGTGTGTATMEEILEQKLVVIFHEPIL